MHVAHALAGAQLRTRQLGTGFAKILTNAGLGAAAVQKPCDRSAAARLELLFQVLDLLLDGLDLLVVLDGLHDLLFQLVSRPLALAPARARWQVQQYLVIGLGLG